MPAIVQGEIYTFEKELPEHGQVIEVQNPKETWLEVLFNLTGDDQWELVFDEDDKVPPDEALQFFPKWREEQISVMTKDIPV